MNIVKQQPLYSGKVKSLYLTDNSDYLIAEFRDDTTAFDGEKHELLANKGMINNLISAFIMDHLQKAGIPTHHVKTLNDNESLVKRLKMIPLECVVRNYAAGSLCRRLGIEVGKQLSPPLFELFLKNDALHDPMINENHALGFGWATKAELKQMQALTLAINDQLVKLCSDANMILVDAKFEFGLFQGEVMLGDEISPDSCRIWDAVSHESLDKDRFRKDMGNVIASYQEIATRLGIQFPK